MFSANCLPLNFRQLVSAGAPNPIRQSDGQSNSANWIANRTWNFSLQLLSVFLAPSTHFRARGRQQTVAGSLEAHRRRSIRTRCGQIGTGFALWPLRQRQRWARSGTQLHVGERQKEAQVGNNWPPSGEGRWSGALGACRWSTRVGRAGRR